MIFTNSKGVKWFLYKKRTIIGRNKIEVDSFYFKKEAPEEDVELPSRYTIMETSNGLPFIKKI